MKFSSLCSLVIALAVVALPFAASAHERQAFEIGDTTYLMVIGSLGEPVVVDDKTAVSLRVLEADPEDIGNSRAEGATPVEGLEESLRVIIAADGQERELALAPAYNQPGVYEALFFPTKATSFSYTVVGEINGTPVELPFTCMPGDHVMEAMEDDTSVVTLSDGVARVFQSGSFTCPREKVTLGFPVESTSLLALQDGVDEVRQMHMAMMNEPVESVADTVTESYQQTVTFFVAVAALLIAVFTLLRGRRV